MRSIFLFLLITFFLSENIRSQNGSFDPKNNLQNVSISQWTAEDGLSSNNITQVFQDSRGLLWITSFNGVMIYDGERIEIYDINNLGILETDGFYTIVEDGQGVIYLGSQGSGIIKYKDDEFSILSSNDSDLPKSIPSLLISKSGVIYAGSNNQGLFKISGDKISKIDIPDLNKSTITSIKEDRNGKLWVATEGHGIFCLIDEKLDSRFHMDSGLLDNYIENLACTNDGQLMIATTKGLQYVDANGELHTAASLSNIYINYLMVDEWNSVWVGTENGVARWNQKLDRVDWIYGLRGIDLIRVSSIAIDDENSIWVSSSRAGLIRLKESMLSNLTRPDISSDKVNIIHESWDGNLYIGTDQNQIDVCKDGNCSTMPITTNLNGNGVRDIFHDKNGSFWLATYVGIIHKDGQGETLYSTDTGMPANNFRTILKDKKGDFWFGSRSGGLVKFRDREILEVFDNENKLGSNFVLSVTEASNGNIYVGTHSGGMSVFGPSGEIKNYKLKEDDSGVLLFNIDLLTGTSAIITANVGLIYFDGEELSLINLVSDRRSKTYFDMVDDERDNFWVTTNLGIMQINKSHWKRYLVGDLTELPYRLLDENNGMNNKECTGATRSTFSSESKILVPTLGGVCEVDPARLLSNDLVPRVQLRNIIVDNIKLDKLENHVSIEPGALRYIFEFAVSSYTAPDRNQYQYILEGFDKDWSKADYKGQIEYTNLTPGNYTFKVIGSNESNIWSADAAEFSFTVKPFFYQTIWFYVSIFLFIMLFFGIFYRWRISFISRQNIELKKVNAELDRFVYSASHEIRSPLSSILGLINLARMGDSDKTQEYFDHIEMSVNRLDDFIHDIVDYSRNARLGIEVDKIDLKGMINIILEDISHTVNFEKIESKIKINIKSDFYSDPKRLKIVLSNIITNAFKHHRPDKVDKPFVSIDVSDERDGVKIKISDNGPGIDKKDQTKVFDMFYRATTSSEGSGLGLYIVEETLEKIHGAIKIQSDKDQGSSFSINLKNLEALYKIDRS